MFHRATLATVTVLLLVASARADDGIDGLIKQLGDDAYLKREAASDRLAEIGEPALDALRQATKSDDPEVRRRILILVESKENAARLAPKRISLHIQSKPMRDVVAELAKQSGYKIDYSAEAGDRENIGYSFDLDNVSFWEALQKISADGGPAC